MVNPIKIEVKIGGIRYDMSKYPPEKIMEVIQHVNAVQSIVEQQNNSTPTEEED